MTSPLRSGAGGGPAPRLRGADDHPDPGAAGGPGAARAPGTAREPEDAHDDGIATVWAAAAVAVLIGVLAAVLDVAAAIGARHRAEAAADLAALAAAGSAVRGREVACARAGDAATGTGGRLALCRLRGWEAVVEVQVDVRLSLLGGAVVRGRARAGPANPQPPVPATPETAEPPGVDEPPGTDGPPEVGSLDTRPAAPDPAVPVGPVQAARGGRPADRAHRRRRAVGRRR